MNVPDPHLVAARMAARDRIIALRMLCPDNQCPVHGRMLQRAAALDHILGLLVSGVGHEWPTLFYLVNRGRNLSIEAYSPLAFNDRVHVLA